MAAINFPVPPSIPLDIRGELPNPLTPWEVSQELFAGLKPPTPGAKYKMVEVLPENKKEWRFIWRYFHHLKPRNYCIKRVHYIRERDQQISFETLFSSIESEATKFPPTWNKESRAARRAAVIQRWKESAQIFSPMETKLPDGRIRPWQHTKVIPLWHGTSRDICDSICTSGFVYFGKNIIPGDDGIPPQNTDDGFYGSGIYFTNSARYAADVYSKGHLLLGWVSMREPFPVVGDIAQTDMAILRGRGAYKNYNAHYIPISPQDPNDPSKYGPTQADQTPICDEYVVFQKAQTLPQYWVELEVELPHIPVLGNSPRFVNELIPHLMRILQNPQIDRDQKLRDFLNKHLSLLLKLPSNEDLSLEQIALYEQITELVTPQGAVNQALRNHMVSALPAQPLPPVQESKEGGPAQFAPMNAGIEEKEPYPVDVGMQACAWVRACTQAVQGSVQSSSIANPSFIEKIKMLHAFQIEKMKLLRAVQEGNWIPFMFTREEFRSDREIVLAAVQQDGSNLQFASEQLKNDRKIVLTAVQQNSFALYFASERLKSDREIVLAAVQQDPLLFWLTNEKLRADKEIRRAAGQPVDDSCVLS